MLLSQLPQPAIKELTSQVMRGPCVLIHIHSVYVTGDILSYRLCVGRKHVCDAIFGKP